MHREDYDKIKDALQKIKSENRKLRRENSQLKKELNRAGDREIERQVEEEVVEELQVVTVEEAEQVQNCPKCRANAVMKVHAGKYVINLCSACGYKKRREVKSKP